MAPTLAHRSPSAVLHPSYAPADFGSPYVADYGPTSPYAQRQPAGASPPRRLSTNNAYLLDIVEALEV
jgi:hypothetical protein